MRLFAAVVPPAPALDELGGAVAGLRTLPGAGRLRWTEPAGWHLALAFYGDVPEEAVPELGARLARAVRRQVPGEVWLAGGGRFAQRVLWAGVAGDRDVLVRLADSATAAARRTGLDMPERRAHRPHLTLARNHSRVDLGPFAAGLDGFVGIRWTVAEVALLRSHLPTDGVPGGRPRYETLGVWPLGR
ncbi:RNA 2',3'-cyclic phosphodiesterase [Streptomyces litchfieldiae]|uniref:RNA 2',3'-cyclic phosphodiesterase n=1 Tax=Streptomyces litchfieldiae TaxID=3075543 RepID=A0ABU2MS82_9ACTN|nr:RNA 2',3'-cyclic phosphodiesterase [Streptomyces sp. DSM 44938]MDT0344203.1 RNA 2',3'-cyclic phosphodiesterase [Streptomyces sp. DSM 44938]